MSEHEVVDIHAALRHLEVDGLLGFPTETVWGIAARARSNAAVAHLRDWKGRADAQPISILVTGPDTLTELGIDASPLARRLMQKFWPGPLTLIMHCTDTRRLAPGIAREDGAVGIRCSSHPGAMQLVEAAAEHGLGPLTATSFNRTGLDPARSFAEALALAADPVPVRVAILDAGREDAQGDPPSTVLDLSAHDPQVIRWGTLSSAELELNQ